MTPNLGDYQKHYSIVLKRLKNEDKALEVFQTSFAKAYAKIDRIGAENFPRYLMTSLINEMNRPKKASITLIHDNEEYTIEGYGTRNHGYSQIETLDCINKITGSLTKMEKQRWLEYAECGTMEDLELGDSSTKFRKSYKTSIVTARLKLRQAYQKHT